MRKRFEAGLETPASIALSEASVRHLVFKAGHGQDHLSGEDFVRSLVFKAGHYVNQRWTTVRWLHLRRISD